MSIAQTMRRVSIYFSICLATICLVLSPVAQPATAQDAAAQAEPSDRDPPRRVAIRFLTEGDFPPFNYYDEDNILTGFNVDVARAVCLELNAACDIQVRPWAELVPALRKGEADAVIASHTASPTMLKVVQFSEPYYFTPARFVAR